MDSLRDFLHLNKDTSDFNGLDNGVPIHKCKGNYGEMKMDLHFEKQGYKCISENRVVDIDQKIDKGIDGIYHNPNGNPPFTIADAKYNTSTLNKKTAQMSDKWILKNLKETIPNKKLREEIEDAIEEGNIHRVLFTIKKDGSVVKHLLDETAQKIKKID